MEKCNCYKQWQKKNDLQLYIGFDIVVFIGCNLFYFINSSEELKIDIDTYKLFSSSLDTIEINISGTEYIFTFNWQIILMSMHENDH